MSLNPKPFGFIVGGGVSVQRLEGCWTCKQDESP